MKRTDEAHAGMIGQRFGRWTVIAGGSRSTTHTRYWLCRCDCGTERQVRQTGLRNGQSRSCRCLSGERAARENHKHGLRGTAEYVSWRAMKSRCLNPNHEAYQRYGGCGIRICDRWLNSFASFLADVGPKPSSMHSLDRFPNPHGNYEPGNIRWATPIEQANNRRPRGHVPVTEAMR